MKKIVSLAIVGMFLIGGFSAIGIQETTSAPVSTARQLTVPPLQMQAHGETSVELTFEGNSDYLMRAGKPVLPKLVETIELPFGARNIEVQVTVQGVDHQTLTAPIRPAPALQPLAAQTARATTAAAEPEKDAAVYEQNDYYPGGWYSYKVGCGLNDNRQHVTHVAVDIYPVRYAPAADTLAVAESATVQVTYDRPDSTPFAAGDAYDMVVIAPDTFTRQLEPLVQHKNDHGVDTLLKTTADIYSEYSGVDEAEQIKYFIKDAIESYGISYVMLVGGLKNQFWARPRDNANIGAWGWHVPVRYTNQWDDPAFPLEEDTIHDPGVISDLYYADVYREGGQFADWDPNGDGIMAAWNKPGVENDTGLDLFPDVAVGRLACRSTREVETVVDKIITYEQGGTGDWFNRMTVISGDGFLDQEDLNIRWDTAELPDGEYTIYAQSNNPEDEYGPVDVVNVTVDKSAETDITFNHDDHLKAALQDGYPAPPIAEICTVSEGNVLGNTNYHYEPGESEAYLNWFTHWANIDYTDEVLTIRGKSYDPQPYGNLTDIHVWIKNSDGDIVFEDWRNDTEMFYEGEWAVGDHAVKGRGGALYYMPESIEPNVVFASNGRFTGMDSVITELNKGSGFMFMSGHGSPNSWGDHYPGVPGNRAGGSLTGLVVTQLRPWFPWMSFPVYPIDSLSNGEKLPIAVIGGCHNSQFNVSMVPTVYHALTWLFPFLNDNYMWSYGTPIPECFSWRFVRASGGGAIASFGNTGLGYGVPGNDCTTGGGDAWITIEIFRQYGAEGEGILGDAYYETVNHYVESFDMTDLGAGHTKTVQQWAFMGDPSLKIGGYD
ncbi:MAG: peptidase C25 [Candidatus Thermoplasmatota archaeon]|nr:peptidase C25 [Candidatus Thermoplasmatota archaeon]